MKPAALKGTGDRVAERVDHPLLRSSSVVATLVVSPIGVVTAVNDKLAAVLGAASPSDLIGSPIAELFSEPAATEAWQHACASGHARGVKLTFDRSDGGKVVLKGDVGPAAAGADGAIAGVFLDVTEEEQLRAAVQRSARMEALGSLTSGIAHDFNNLLTVLVGNLYLAAEDVRDNASAFPKLKTARDAAKRGADLVRQLLAFARRESVEMETVDPARVVEGLVPLLQRALGSKIALEPALRPAGATRCSAAQLESAIVNLAVNARDAMQSGGKIRISVDTVELDARRAERARPRLPAGTYIQLAVADDGCGIAPEMQARVFEPFYSTKTERGGTGLGLSMVKWFADQAGGAVRLESVVGKGTRVSLLLPCMADVTAETSAKTMPLSTLKGGDESVLIVAREDNVRTMIKQILDVLGYEVHSCAEPGEALRVLRSKRIDLLLADASGQQDGARQLLRAAQQVQSKMSVVLAVDPATARCVTDLTAASLLAKPFSIADVANAVRRALDTAAAPATGR